MSLVAAQFGGLWHANGGPQVGSVQNQLVEQQHELPKVALKMSPKDMTTWEPWLKPPLNQLPSGHPADYNSAECEDGWIFFQLNVVELF